MNSQSRESSNPATATATATAAAASVSVSASSGSAASGASAASAGRLPTPGRVRTGRFPGGDGNLPLLVEPAGGAATERSADALVEWLRQDPAATASALARHGALFMRGFHVPDARAFERVARAISDDLKNDYLGTSPRDALTDYVFSASELPPYYPIPQHCEMSFVPSAPARLFFWCGVAPRSEGGETPLCDVRAVWRDLDPRVRDRFEQEGVRIIRNYCGPDGGGRLDLWKLKRWDEMFRTTDRAAVERVCEANGFEYTWGSGGRLRLVSTQPAMRRHPTTGEPAWFNHSQVFHLSSAPGEYRRIAARLGGPRYHGLRWFARAAVEWKRRRTRLEDQAMHCTYGDGSEIPDADMERVREAIWKNLVFPRWQQGDVVAIDNFAVAHGRMPYRGPRMVAVAWA